MADDLQTWFTASGIQTLLSLFKMMILIDLELLFNKVKFAPKCFCMGIFSNIGFLETIEVYELKDDTNS